MEYTLFDFLKLIGALGFFIYGMTIMSEGIQKAAGSKMREILGAMTSNRFKGVFTGLFITSIIQSSSATTVMVVSFVNAGLLSLIEAIGVIMGANIGTTVTAWLVAFFGFKFSIAAFALPVIAFGFPMMFFKSEKMRALGEFLIGFALLFMGLDALKNAVPDIKGNPEVLYFLGTFSNHGILSTIFFVGVGTLLTVVIQSSSAAMALTLTLVYKGILPLETAAALCLGENIGTTITANLAALVANVHAKRAAVTHSLFNITGVVWAVLTFPFYLKFIGWLWQPAQAFMVQFIPDLGMNSAEMQLALFHTMFNTINVILLIGFVKQLAWAAERIVKQKEGEKEDFHLEFIGRGILQTPELSLLEAKKEIVKYAEIDRKGVTMVRDLINQTDEKAREELIERIRKYEEITDRIELEVDQYLTKVSEAGLSESSSNTVRGMITAVNHLETIGDIFYQMSKAIERKNKKKIWFDQEQRNELNEMFALADRCMAQMETNLKAEEGKVDMAAVAALEKEINERRNQLRKRNFKQIEKGKIKLDAGLIYMDLISGYEKVADNAKQVSEAVAGVNLE
jgi:phosphate:Na+ symporter